MKNIVILGTGGTCTDILDTLHDINSIVPTYTCIGFLDDNQDNWGKEFYGIKVLGPLSIGKDLKDTFFVNGIGSPANFWNKEKIIAQTQIPLEKFETLIHPTASVSRMSTLGRGVVVFQQVTITSNVHIGNHVIILPHAVVSHDDDIGDYTCIAAGVSLSGGVTVGASCYLGTQSSYMCNIVIGEQSLIGMGSTVLNDVAPCSVMVGTPALLKRKTY